MRCLYFVTVLWLALLLDGASSKAPVCGYRSCNSIKSNMLNVHLVPHSHDEVGWLKTVDQYYYGKRNDIQHGSVRYILDNVVQELLKNSKRRFIYAESVYFFKWYNEQLPAMQKNVKKLIAEGRLQFAGGAWSMNDEATVHYQSIIDQFSLGLRYLATTFGTCARPRVGWQIDTFGHSREMASLFAQMGYDGEFFARLDWVEKKVRITNLTAEMIWKASSDELFTGILFNHYISPPTFCFDTSCSGEPIIDGYSFENNVKKRVDDFLSYINNMAKYYRSNHLLVPMGDDFNYENAIINFKNIDKLIRYVNERQGKGSDINVLYSTPACYLNALHKLQLTWPTKTQDFFPYSSERGVYWTGYYTSRPTLKRFERVGNHFLQVSKQLTTFANLTTPDVMRNLDGLRQVMGIMQHHHAITGTEKQQVAYDYSRLLSSAIEAAHTSTRLALRKLTNLTSGEFVSCLQLNVSVCEFSKNLANNLVITLYNPLTHTAKQFVRIPVKNETYVVKDMNGRVVRSQLVPIAKEVMDLSFRSQVVKHELVFEANVRKLANYYVKNIQKKTTGDNHDTYKERETQKRYVKWISKVREVDAEERARGDIVVQNSLIKLTFSNNTGHLVEVNMNGVCESIRQDFFYYKSAASDSKESSSGAYIFRPNGSEFQISEDVNLTIVEGSLVKEVHQHYTEWVSQVIRIYEGVNRVEFEWLVGPIPLDDGHGKDIITRFSSDLDSNDVFWTDSNGRERIRRVRNEREYFKADLKEEISGNYYPITSLLALQNEQKRIALLNDRAQGGTSVKSGTLELMLHRRLLRDDHIGVKEVLNEEEHGKGLIVRGKVHLILSSALQKPTIFERVAQRELHLPLWKFFSTSTKATNKVPPRIPDFSYLPTAIEVLTLEPFGKKKRLLRLENFMDRNETATITINVHSIFDALGGEEISETTLDGNMRLRDMKRFKFQQDGSRTSKTEYILSKHPPLFATKRDNPGKFIVGLQPMQIRTFVIKWK